MRSSPFTTIVILEIAGSSVSHTARESMLNPRAAKRVDILARTPNLFSTKTEIVWCIHIPPTPYVKPLN